MDKNLFPGTENDNDNDLIRIDAESKRMLRILAKFNDRSMAGQMRNMIKREFDALPVELQTTPPTAQ